MNVNANAMKQECVFSHDEDMTEAEVYVRPQDGMTQVSVWELMNCELPDRIKECGEWP